MKTRIDYSRCKSSTADSKISTSNYNNICFVKQWKRKVNGTLHCSKLLSEQINRQHFQTPNSSMKKKKSTRASINSCQLPFPKLKDHSHASSSFSNNRQSFFVPVPHLILILTITFSLSSIVESLSLPSNEFNPMTMRKMTKMRGAFHLMLEKNARPRFHSSLICTSAFDSSMVGTNLKRKNNFHLNSCSSSTSSTTLFSVSPSKIFTNQKTNNEITHDFHHSAVSLSHQRTTNKIFKNDENIKKETNNDKMELQQRCWEKVFSLDLPEGKCVGLRLIPMSSSDDPNSTFWSQIQCNSQHSLRQYLHPKEIDYALSNMPSESARNTFLIGRLAMRSAMNELKEDCYNKNKPKSPIQDKNDINLPLVSDIDESILKDQHGRPKVPASFIGSISHKQLTGVALVSINVDKCNVNSPQKSIGIDLEQTLTKGRSIATKVLTENELKDLGKIKGVSEDEEVLLRFSLKESVYKAMHPLICQFVSFQEAEIKPNEDGTAKVILNLKNGAHDNFASVSAHWRRIDQDYFLTSASVTLKDNIIE